MKATSVLVGSIVFFWLSLAGLAAAAQQMHWSVQSTTIKTQYNENGKLVEKYREEYYLYYGSQETLDTEKKLNAEHVFSCFYLLHPGPEVTMPFAAPHRWYIGTRLSRRLSPPNRALFDEEIWQQIPGEVKSVLNAFGIDNPDLLLVWYDRHTGSIQVFFHPRYDEDQDFYRRKLGIITEYSSHPKSSA
jgi:hypothetical protein